MQAVAHAERLSSHLASQIEAQTRDPDWTLAHYTFVASVTALAAECDIAHSPAMSVASRHAMPRPRVAFIGKSAELLANYATFLISHGSEIELLVDDTQRTVVEQAFKVISSEPYWQMVFRGDPAALDPGAAVELTDNDLTAMQTLAKSVQVELQFVAQDPFQQGPAFGIWEDCQLAAMGVTDLRLPDVVQIGNIVAAESAARHQYIAAVVSALVKAHAECANVFCVIPHQHESAVGLLETLGFVRERPMYRMRCVFKEVT